MLNIQRKSNSKFSAYAVIAATALSVPAYATDIVVNQTLDITQPMAGIFPAFYGWQGTPAFDGGFNVAIAEGDTFDFTIDFLGSQALTVNNPAQVWVFSFADQDSDVKGTGTFSFLDASGLPILTSNVKTDTEGAIHFGQYFRDSDFAGGLPSSITFSGVRYSGTLDDYIDSGVTIKNYDRPAFMISAVPEPGTYAMLLVGLGLLGSMARRRKETSM
jgi:hypothetical protein